MRGKKADGMLAGDGLKWQYSRSRPVPPSLSSKMKRASPSISEAMKGRSATISTSKVVPRKRKGVGLYGPWQFSHFGRGSLSQLGKKIYRDGHR